MRAYGSFASTHIPDHIMFAMHVCSDLNFVKPPAKMFKHRIHKKSAQFSRTIEDTERKEK